MAKFKPHDYRQTSMVVINCEDQLQPGTFEHAIHHLVDKNLDLSIFHPHYQGDDTGRSAYDPTTLLKIILAPRFLTSRRSRVSSAAFPARQIEQLFEQILLICYERGLLDNELFAIDGCEVASNAAKEWSGTFWELEQKRQKIKRQILRCLEEHRTSIRSPWEARSAGHLFPIRRMDCIKPRSYFLYVWNLMQGYSNRITIVAA